MAEPQEAEDLAAAGRFDDALRAAARAAEATAEPGGAVSWAQAGLFAAAIGKRGESAKAMQRSRALLRAHPHGADALTTRAYLALATIVLGHDARARSAIAGLRGEARRGDEAANALADATQSFRERYGGHADGAVDLEQPLRALDDAGRASLVRVIRALPERAPERGKVALLSEAEKRVLLLAAGGATSKEIAAELGRSSQTVDVHIRSICRKLGVSGRRQAVVAAIRQGLIAERRSR